MQVFARENRAHQHADATAPQPVAKKVADSAS
jgi:hypothetical protein